MAGRENLNTQEIVQIDICKLHTSCVLKCSSKQMVCDHFTPKEAKA